VSVVKAESDVVAGAVLAGKYRVERLLGQGGMGVVVEARHTQLDDRVALKFLLPEYSANPDAAARFLREARAAVKIKSPHVARVSDVGTLENGAPYMVMEYLEGADASRVLEAGQVLPLAEAIDYIVQACDALADAHAQGIIHRDIKPANLFVTRHADGTPFVKVLDFGISKVLGEAGGVDNLTRTTATMGSALYMSPEQIRQSKSVDRRTDIYALGITLYELLAGKQPFVAESFAALCVEVATGTPALLLEARPDLPPDFGQALARAYARDPDARYQTVAELVVALAPWAPPRAQPIIERIARAGGLIAAHGVPPGRGSITDVRGAVAAQTTATGSSAGSTHMNSAITGAVIPRKSSVVPIVAVLGGIVAFAALGVGALVFAKGRAVHVEAPAASESAEQPAPSMSTSVAAPASTPEASVEPVPGPAPSAAVTPKVEHPTRPKIAVANKPPTVAVKPQPKPAVPPTPTATKPPTNVEGMR
jgi:serine/threonine-protein kinase